MRENFKYGSVRGMRYLTYKKYGGSDMSTRQQRFKLAVQDIIDGILSWRIWLLLGWQDIRLRYRRSQLGPFWLTLSMAVTVYSMGFLYGHLFKMDLQQYFPFLAAGMLIWALVATSVNESTNAFIEGAGYLKQMKLPYITFILRVMVRNIIIFAHNILAIVPIIIYCHISFGWHTLAIVWGVFIIAVNGTVYGMILAMLGARFRDIAQVIQSVIQVIFFLTPVMWMPKLLPAKYLFVMDFNPFAQFIELVRVPLMGAWPSFHTITFTLGLTIFGLIAMILLFARVRHRIIYWL